MTTPLSFNGYFVRDDRRIYQSFNTAPSTFGPFFYMFLTPDRLIEGQAGVLSFYTPNSGQLTRTPFIYLTEFPDVFQRIQLCPVYDVYNYGMYLQVTQFWGNTELGRTQMRYLWYLNFGGGQNNTNQPTSINSTRSFVTTATTNTNANDLPNAVLAPASSLPKPEDLDLENPFHPQGVTVKDIIRVRLDDKTGEWCCENEEHLEHFETHIKPKLVVPKDQVPQYLSNRMSDEEIKKFKKKWLAEQEKKNHKNEKEHEKEDDKHALHVEKKDGRHDKKHNDDKKHEEISSEQDSARIVTTEASMNTINTATANNPFTSLFNYYPDPSNWLMPDYYQENSGKKWQIYDVWYTGFKLQNTAAGDKRTATAAWEWDSNKGKYIIYFKFFDPTGNILQALLRGSSDDMFNVKLENGDTFAGGFNPYNWEP